MKARPLLAALAGAASLAIGLVAAPATAEACTYAPPCPASRPVLPALRVPASAGVVPLPPGARDATLTDAEGATVPTTPTADRHLALTAPVAGTHLRLAYAWNDVGCGAEVRIERDVEVTAAAPWPRTAGTLRLVRQDYGEVGRLGASCDRETFTAFTDALAFEPSTELRPFLDVAEITLTSTSPREGAAYGPGALASDTVELPIVRTPTCEAPPTSYRVEVRILGAPAAPAPAHVDVAHDCGATAGCSLGRAPAARAPGSSAARAGLVVAGLAALVRLVRRRASDPREPQ